MIPLEIPPYKFVRESKWYTTCIHGNDDKKEFPLFLHSCSNCGIEKKTKSECSLLTSPGDNHDDKLCIIVY